MILLHGVGEHIQDNVSSTLNVDQSQN